jgi:hypothetical protein
LILAVAACGGGSTTAPATTDDAAPAAAAPDDAPPAPDAAPAPPPTHAIDIQPGGGTMFALLSDGTVRAWGRGDAGQLGTGARSPDAATPVRVPGVTDVDQLAVETVSGAACARNRGGGWVCWGAGDGLPGLVDEPRPPHPVHELDGAPVVRLGHKFGCAILATGRVACWGREPTQGTYLSDPPRPVHELDGVDDAAELHIKGLRVCVRRGDGSVVCWGYDGWGQATGSPSVAGWAATPQRVPGVDDAIELGLGEQTTCARRRSGELACWGRAFGGVATVTTAPGGRFIDPGPMEVCERIPAGKVRCHDGAAWTDADGPPRLDHASHWQSHCIVSLDREVVCWGRNDHGQLGDGTLIDRAYPRVVAALVDPPDPPPPPVPPPPDLTAPVTAWGDRPAACRIDPVITVRHPRVEPADLPVRVAWAHVDEWGGRILLANHAVASERIDSPDLRGDQRVVELHLMVRGKDDDYDLGPVTRGRYPVRSYESTAPGRRSSGMIGTSREWLDWSADGFSGEVVIDRLDDDWVCGKLDLRAQQGRISGRFAAERRN